MNLTRRLVMSRSEWKTWENRGNVDFSHHEWKSMRLSLDVEYACLLSSLFLFLSLSLSFSFFLFLFFLSSNFSIKLFFSIKFYSALWCWVERSGVRGITLLPFQSILIGTFKSELFSELCERGDSCARKWLQMLRFCQRSESLRSSSMLCVHTDLQNKYNLSAYPAN